MFIRSSMMVMAPIKALDGDVILGQLHPECMVCPSSGNEHDQTWGPFESFGDINDIVAYNVNVRLSLSCRAYSYIYCGFVV